LPLTAHRQCISPAPDKAAEFPTFSANLPPRPLSPRRSTLHIGAMPRPRRVVVLAVPPIEELDLVAPVQVLSTANRLTRGNGRPYDIQVVTTTQDRLIAGESGLCIVARAHYRALTGEIDSLLLVSGTRERNRRDPELEGWLRRAAPGCR